MGVRYGLRSMLHTCHLHRQHDRATMNSCLHNAGAGGCPGRCRCRWMPRQVDAQAGAGAGGCPGRCRWMPRHMSPHKNCKHTADGHACAMHLMHLFVVCSCTHHSKLELHARVRACMHAYVRVHVTCEHASLPPSSFCLTMKLLITRWDHTAHQEALDHTVGSHSSP